MPTAQYSQGPTMGKETVIITHSAALRGSRLLQTACPAAIAANMAQVAAKAQPKYRQISPMG